MTSFSEYKIYYLTYIERLLGIREQAFDVMSVTLKDREEYFNLLIGTKVLLLVAFIESNFLTKQQMKKLRNFEQIEELTENVRQTELSCFIYIRDCVGHNPKLNLFDSGSNTIEFQKLCEDGKFKHAEISEGRIILSEGAIHRLHILIRSLYGL